MKIVRLDDSVAFERPGAAPLPVRHIIGIGRNYPSHARETGHPVPVRPLYFTKNPGAAALDGEDIVVPVVCQDREQVDYEGELAVVLGRAACNVAEAEALGYVLGYCAANDVSARWWQYEGAGGQFNRGKSFDTFCPLGPELVPAAAVPDPQALRVRTYVNGALRQDAATADMHFPVARLIAELSRATTLLPGTVILTGTPEGVGYARKPPLYLRDGDLVVVDVAGIGRLTNRVRFARA